MLGLLACNGSPGPDKDTPGESDVDQNAAPLAAAGDDAVYSKGSPFSLDGSASSDADGDALTFAWSQVSGPETAALDATLATPEVDALCTGGDHVFALVVSDGQAESDPDEVTVQLTNTVPVADAGDGARALTATTVALDGSASADADACDTLTYTWTQVAGTPVTLLDADTAQPSFVAPDQADTVRFELVVGDGESSSAPATVEVEVFSNDPPATSAGEDATYLKYDVVLLDGSGTVDPDNHALTYLWEQLDGRHAMNRRLPCAPRVRRPICTPMSADAVWVM